VNQSPAGLGVRTLESELPPNDRPRRAADEVVNLRSSIAFFALHLLPFLAILTGVTRTALLLAVGTFTIRGFFITGGYHRYFSHKSYRLNRFWQFVFAFGGTTASQKGPLWWAAHHRNHHRFSDTERDIHSPKRGFWWSHVGWILCDKYNGVEVDQIRDLVKYPELRFINRRDWIGPWALGVCCFLIGGWSGLLIGFFASTVLLWHVTFMVNSVAHVFGRRAYDTTDTSRNSVLVAIATGGEGWHNNHHRYPWAARQGFRWWQVDPTYYCLRVLQALGIVSELRPVPVTVIDEARAARARRRASDTSPSSPR
jgi:stearoyl-CoA desaturase (delta-9 desaturase)